jgi:hypothetical protein
VSKQDAGLRNSQLLLCQATIAHTLRMNPKLSRKAVDDFKTIYFEEFGQKLSDTEAQEMAGRLLSICRTIFAGLSTEAG